MNKYVQNGIIGFFSLLFIIFGSNKFFGFLELQLPADPIAKTFLVTMFTSYLVKLVGFAQVAGAVLLLIPRTRFLGTLLFLPVIVNIAVFHLAHDNPGNGLWIFVSLLYAVIVYFQKNNFAALLKIQDPA